MMGPRTSNAEVVASVCGVPGMRTPNCEAGGWHAEFRLGQVLRKTKRPLDASLRAESTETRHANRL